MNSLLRIPYSFAGNLAQVLTRVAPSGQSKFARGLSARRDLIARYQQWAVAQRDPTRPLLWLHAPSVGEGLQALPVIELLRARRPDIQIAYTFYSPSAERFARGLDVDVTDYLPFDTFSNAAAILSTLRPDALVFSKLDVWTALTETAPSYRLLRVGNDIPVPVLVAVDDGGAAVEVETWSVPSAALPEILAGSSGSVCLGRVTLVDGSTEIGFVADASVLGGTTETTDITEFGGWRNYLAAQLSVVLTH